MMQEEINDKNQRLSLIEDIMKMHRLFSKYDNKPNSEYKNNPAGIFDRLYDMDINDLEITAQLMEMKLNKALREEEAFIKDLLKGMSDEEV